MNISNLFEQDAKLLGDLLSLLSREQSSLVNADIDTIETLLDEKGELLQKISASVQVRYKALQKAGFEPSENGMVAWLHRNGERKQQEAWNNFQQTLDRAKEVNRVNGHLISKHFNRNQQSLNHLQGKPANGGVYSQSGHATSHNYSRAAQTV